MVSAIPKRPDQALDAIISAYNEVTERLKQSHDRLAEEVRRLRGEVEEKNRELARRERLAALGEMAAGVAHEIRNPLCGINLFASVLCADLSDRPQCRQLARKIVAGVRTLDGVVGDILAFAGQAPVESRPVRIAEVINAVVELVEPQREASNTTIHIATSLVDVQVSADFDQLQRAILNITLNAIEAAEPDGNVWFSATEGETQAEVCLKIADDGPGINPSIRERVFNPFFTTKDTGTGLGLAIAHRIAEAHGGRVGVGPRPGGGAIFRLTLKAARDR